MLPLAAGQKEVVLQYPYSRKSFLRIRGTVVAAEDKRPMRGHRVVLLDLDTGGKRFRQETDTDRDGDNDGSELSNAKNPLAPGDGHRLTIGLTKVAGGTRVKWYRGTTTGTFDGPPCNPGVSSPPCIAIGNNDAIDGHFRVYVSADAPRITATSFHKEPDGVVDGADDLDNPDQRDHVVTDAEAPSGTILYFLTLNWGRSPHCSR